jgi:HJR/Mrr/RecB family endonuclease
MGLGKTLQLLCFIEWHSSSEISNKPYLIVAPKSLLVNWESEHKKFFPSTNLEFTKLYGSVNLTREFDAIVNQKEAERFQKQHIILTTYETLRNYQFALGLIDFAVIVLDEAQKIKSPGTYVTNACKALKADFKIAMTGTPVENTLIDLWCILDFAVPGLLGNASEFAKEFHNPLRDESADIHELTERLNRKIGIFIKRRMKRDVAKELPRKHDNKDSRITEVMPSPQLERYKIQIEIINNSNLAGVESRNQKLRFLHAIRDISDHPYLLDNQILNFTSEELIESSAKLQITIKILETVKVNNEKVIVFAERKETQRMLQKVIYEKFSVFPSIINGDTPSMLQGDDATTLSRQQAIDRFENVNGFNIIVMSPLAAGVGLNVTGANHVIHYSRHWNPAKEEQATDRAYRIGQTKDVFVYYPMAVFPDYIKDENGEKVKSFDEVLDNLLKIKKDLASKTLFPSVRAEVEIDELFGKVFGFETESKVNDLAIDQIDSLNPNLFEAAVAVLYQKQGYNVYLTPYSNDKGADIVLLSESENLLFQVKQTRYQVGKEAIQEICTAKRYYESQFNVSFSLTAITNNDYTANARLLARTNGVNLINRQNLIELLNKYSINIREINQIELQRMQKI